MGECKIAIRVLWPRVSDDVVSANAEIKGLGDGITDWLWLEHHEEVLQVECRHVERAFNRQISNIRLYSYFAVEVLDAA